jgi:hypothetical protein
MDDTKLYRSIEAIEDAKAMADSIWRMGKLSGLDDAGELAATAEICTRLAVGIARLLECSADDLKSVHQELLARGTRVTPTPIESLIEMD